LSTVEFYWTPDPVLYAERLNAVAASLENRVIPLAAASEAIRADIQERFETETDPSGAPWEDWAETYQPYAEAYPNEGILKQTTELEEAATATEATVVTNETVFYRTNALPHYGLAHDLGLPDRKNPLPQREFLGMSDEAVGEIMGSFYQWFEGSLDLFVRRGRIAVANRDPSSGRFAPADAEFI